MGPCMFSAIFLFSIFSCQRVDATGRQTKDEVALAHYKPSEFFTNLEYELEINFDSTNNRMPYSWGSVLITMECIKKCNTIFLDREHIHIPAGTTEAWKRINGETDQPVGVHYGRYVNEKEGYKIKLEEYMQLVRASLLRKLKFSAVIFYSRVDDLFVHGIFPVFNRLSMKAKFKIRIGHLNNVQSFTNANFIDRKSIDNPETWLHKLDEFDRRRLKSNLGEMENEETLNDLPKIWVMDEFVKTDLMSPTSLALTVVDYSSTESAFRYIGPSDSDHLTVEIRVWAQQDILNHMQEILIVAAESSEYFADFFDVSYTLGKLDLIVLPDKGITVKDYYGLIYLGENTVKNVFTEPNHYRPDRYLLARKICQAVSRQWIGHYVTLSGFYESWFYDGLHSYLQRHCVLNAFPDWTVDIQLDVIDSFITLLKTEERGRDYNPTAKLNSLYYFNGALNSETKLKIHFVIRLLNFILESKKDLFQKSLSEYINQFKSTTAPNLQQVWDSFTKTANKAEGSLIWPKNFTFESIIFSWLIKTGYPLINVSRDKAAKQIILSQEEFTFPDQGDFKDCWSFPFDMVTKAQTMSDKEKKRSWLSCINLTPRITLSDGEENEWIAISLGLQVPGRVYYDLESRLLIQKLFHNENEISRVDSLTRIHLIHDMFTLAEASKYTYDFVFETMKYVSHEGDYKCWHVILQELRRVRSRWSGTSLFKPLQKFVLAIVQPIFEEKIQNIDAFLSSERSSNELEKLILETACTFEHPKCQEYSENLLNNLNTHDNYQVTNRVSESLREIFYCLAMKNAEESTWNRLLKKYEEPGDLGILRALGCSRNGKILQKFLNWCMDKENPNRSPELCLDVFEILSSSSIGYQLITPFIKKSHGSLNKKYKVLNSLITSFQTDVTIDDFLLKAIESTKTQKDLNKPYV